MDELKRRAEEAAKRAESRWNPIPSDPIKSGLINKGIRFQDPSQARIEESYVDQGQVKRRLASLRSVVENATSGMGDTRVVSQAFDNNGDPVLRVEYRSKDPDVMPTFRDIKVTNEGVVMLGNSDSDSFSIVPATFSFNKVSQKGKDDFYDIQPGSYSGIANNLRTMIKSASPDNFNQLNSFEQKSNPSLGPSGGLIDYGTYESNPAYLAKLGVSSVSVPRQDAQHGMVEGKRMIEGLTYVRDVRKNSPLPGETESDWNLGFRKAGDKFASAVGRLARASVPFGTRVNKDTGQEEDVSYHTKGLKHLMGTWGSRRTGGRLLKDGRYLPESSALMGFEGSSGLNTGSVIHSAMFANRMGFIEGEGLVPDEDYQVETYRRSFMRGYKPDDLDTQIGDVFLGGGMMPKSVPHGTRNRGKSSKVGDTGAPLSRGQTAIVDDITYDSAKQGTWVGTALRSAFSRSEMKWFNAKSQSKPVRRESNPHFRAADAAFGSKMDFIDPMPDPGERFAGKAFMIWLHQAAEDPTKSDAMVRRQNMLNQFFDEAQARDTDASGMIQLVGEKNQVFGHVRRTASGFQAVRNDGSVSETPLENILSSGKTRLSVSKMGTEIATDVALQYAASNMKPVTVENRAISAEMLRQIAFQHGLKEAKEAPGFEGLDKEDQLQMARANAQGWFDKTFSKADFIGPDGGSVQRGKESFDVMESTKGYWNVTYEDLALETWLPVSPVANLAKNSASVSGEQLSLLRQFQPEVAGFLADQANRMPNMARDILRTRSMNQDQAVTTNAVPIESIDFQKIDDEVRKELDPKGYTTTPTAMAKEDQQRELTMRKTLEGLIKKEVLRRVDTVTGGSPLITHDSGKLLPRAAAGSTYMNSTNKDSVGYGTALYDYLRDKSASGTVGKAFMDLSNDGSVLSRSQKNRVPAFTGPANSQLGLPDDMVVARPEDYLNMLKRQGVGKAERKRQMKLFRQGGANAYTTLYPAANRAASQYVLRMVSDEYVRENYPGMEDLVVPEGGIIASPEFVASQAKDQDGDRIVSFALPENVGNRTSDITAKGMINRGFELQGVFKKAMYSAMDYLNPKKASALAESKGIPIGSISDYDEVNPKNSFAAQGVKSAMSQERMGVDFNQMVRDLGEGSEFAIKTAMEEGLIDRERADGLRNAYSLFGQDVYQLSLDMDKSTDPSTLFLEKMMGSGVLHGNMGGMPGYHEGKNLISLLPQDKDGNIPWSLQFKDQPTAAFLGQATAGKKKGSPEEALADMEARTKHQANVDVVAGRQESIYARKMFMSMLTSHQQHRLSDRGESEELYLGSGLNPEGGKLKAGIVRQHAEMLTPMSDQNNIGVIDKVEGLLTNLFNINGSPLDKETQKALGTKSDTFNLDDKNISDKVALDFFKAIGYESANKDSVEDLMNSYVFGDGSDSISERSMLALTVNAKVGANQLFPSRKVSQAADIPEGMQMEAAALGKGMLDRHTMTRTLKSGFFREGFDAFSKLTESLSGYKGIYEGFQDIAKKVKFFKEGGNTEEDQWNIAGEDGPELVGPDRIVIPHEVSQDLEASSQNWLSQQEGIEIEPPEMPDFIPSEPYWDDEKTNLPTADPFKGTRFEMSGDEIAAMGSDQQRQRLGKKPGRQYHESIIAKNNTLRKIQRAEQQPLQHRDASWHTEMAELKTALSAVNDDLEVLKDFSAGDALSQQLTKAGRATYEGFISQFGGNVPDELKEAISLTAVVTDGITNNISKIESPHFSEQSAINLQSDIGIVQAMVRQQQETPEVAQDAKWLKKLGEATGRVGYTQAQLISARQGGLGADQMGNADAVREIEALLGFGGDGQTETRSAVKSAMSQARQLQRQNLDVLQEDYIGRATSGVTTNQLDEVNGAIGAIDVLNKEIGKMPSILEGTAKAQERHYKQMQIGLNTYEKMTETLANLNAIKDEDLTDYQRQTKSGLESPEVQQFMSMMKDNLESRGAEMEQYKVMAGFKPKMDEDEREARLMGLIQRRGASGRAARLDRANEDLWEGGLNTAFGRLESRESIERYGQVARGMDAAKSGLFTASMLRYNLGTPLSGMVDAYQRGEMQKYSALMGTSNMSFDDYMSGDLGNLRRRSAMAQSATETMGGQIYNAFSPVLDFALGQSGARTMGNAAAVLAPAGAAGMMAKSMLPETPGAAMWAGLAAGGLALAGSAAGVAGDVGQLGTAIQQRRQMIFGDDRNQGLNLGTFGRSVFGVVTNPTDTLAMLGSAIFDPNKFAQGEEYADASDRAAEYYSGEGYRGMTSSEFEQMQLDDYAESFRPSDVAPDSARIQEIYSEMAGQGLLPGKGIDNFGWNSETNQFDEASFNRGNGPSFGPSVGNRLTDEQLSLLNERIAQETYASDFDPEQYRAAIKKVNLNAYLNDQESKGFNRSESLNFYNFAENYGTGVAGEGALQKQLQGLELANVIGIPQTGVQLAASMGVGSGSTQVMDYTRQLADHLSAPGTNRFLESERIKTSIARNTQVNPLLARSEMDQRQFDFYGAGSGVFADDTNRQSALDDAYMMAARSRMGTNIGGNYTGNFLNQQRRLIEEGQYRTASVQSAQYGQIGGFLQQYATYGNPANTARNEGLLYDLSTRGEREFNLGSAFLRGDTRAATMLAGNNEALRFTDLATGLGKFEEGINASELSQLMDKSGSAMRYGYVDGGKLPDSRYGQSVRGYQAEVRDLQREMGIKQYEFSRDFEQMNYSMQAGGASSLTPLPGVDSATASLQKLGAAAEQSGGALSEMSKVFEKYGYQLDQGDGRSLRQVEDDSIRLSREKQSYGMAETEKDLEIGKEKFDMEARQFYERMALSREQMQYGMAYQGNEMQIGRQQQVKQQQWQQEDWSFGRSQMEIGFAWSMEDSDRSIRYARGRERRDLMRQRDRQVIQHTMQASKSDIDQDRMQETNQWSAERFEREKSHFEQTNQFQIRNFEMQIRHFEEGRSLEEDKMQRERDRFAMEKVWMAEQWANEDQQRLLSRQAQDIQFVSQQKFNEELFNTQQNIANISELLSGIQLTMVDANAAFETMVATGDALNELAGALGLTPTAPGSSAGSISVEGAGASTNPIADLAKSTIEKNTQQTVLMEKMVTLLQQIVDMGPGRVDATIYTNAEKVQSTDLTAFEGAYGRN